MTLKNTTYLIALAAVINLSIGCESEKNNIEIIKPISDLDINLSLSDIRNARIESSIKIIPVGKRDKGYYFKIKYLNFPFKEDLAVIGVKIKLNNQFDNWELWNLINEDVSDGEYIIRPQEPLTLDRWKINYYENMRGVVHSYFTRVPELTESGIKENEGALVYLKDLPAGTHCIQFILKNKKVTSPLKFQIF